MFINTFANPIQQLYKYNYSNHSIFKNDVSKLQMDKLQMDKLQMDKLQMDKFQMAKYIAISNNKYIALYNKYNNNTIKSWSNNTDFKEKQQKQQNKICILKYTLTFILNVSFYLVLASFKMQ